MRIRSAKDSDEDAVIELWRAHGLVAVYNDPSVDFHFALAGSCSGVLVGEDEAGKVAGTVMVGHDGHRGWLYYVASRDQRKGHGRALVEAGESWLRDRKIRKCQILIRDSNRSVLPFYLQCGYSVEPRIVCAKWLIDDAEGNR